MKWPISVLIAIAIALTLQVAAEPADDRITQLPGYPPSFTNRVYGGYLNTLSTKRSLHYIFI